MRDYPFASAAALQAAGCHTKRRNQLRRIVRHEPGLDDPTNGLLYSHTGGCPKFCVYNQLVNGQRVTTTGYRTDFGGFFTAADVPRMTGEKNSYGLGNTATITSVTSNVGLHDYFFVYERTRIDRFGMSRNTAY